MLGPFEVERDGAPVRIPTGKQRALLASLAVRAERGASADELVERLWGEEAPHGARTTIRGYVMRLRRLLDEGSAGAGSAIESGELGYRLTIDPENVDLSRFHALVGRAGTETDETREAGLLGEALALWRGPALCDVACDSLQREVLPVLNEKRLHALHRRNELALSRGESTALLPELGELVAEYPMEERFWAQLLLALHKAGRQAAVLTRFAECRQVMNEHLGVEPGTQVQEIFERILAEDRDAGAGARTGAASRTGDGAARPGGEEAPHAAAPDPAAPRPAAPDPAPRDAAGAPAPHLAVPRQLPPDVVPFTGRVDELAELDRLVGGRRDRAGSRCVLVDGPAGVGKTALAVHWAHRAARCFPDGQLHIDLNGFGPGEPVEASQALRVLLLGAGVPREQVPAETSARSALLRTLLAGRRVLVILDNAVSAEQVRALLPGSTATVLVTSRSGLRGLVARDGAARVRLGRFTKDEAARLLAELLGKDRCAGQRLTLAELAVLCERLPLTLRIVAERASRHPDWPLGHFVNEVRNSPPVSAFDTGEDRTGLHAMLSRSYRVLEPAPARLFRLLGSHRPRAIEPDSVARLLGIQAGAAGRLLDELADVNLIEHTAPGHFEVDSVCRSFAASLAGETRRSAGRARMARR